MIEEYEKNRRKQVSFMRSIGDFVMGFIFIAAGIFVLFRNRLDLAINEKYPSDWIDIVLGAMFILYGGWRIYRGYKKKYFV